MALHRCRVKLVSDRCDGHDLCVEIQREVPRELRCSQAEPAGYGETRGNGPNCGCRTPADLKDLVCRELRDNIVESTRIGFVRIKAA